MPADIATLTPSSTFSEAYDSLHTAARQQTGLEDFGDPSYQEGLRVLLGALDSDSSFSDTGRETTAVHIIGVLKARLYTEAEWKRHPGYHTATMRPLVITAIPRSGTSALHRLLSVDPQFQGLQRWLAAAPTVRPPRQEWSSYPGYRASKKSTEDFNRQSPEFTSAHEEAADEVEECMEVLQQSFVSNMFASRFPTPTYTRWLMQQNERDSYQRYADVLRLIGSADQDQRWLLKNPGHTWYPELLFEVFPEAYVIQTHRDPATAVTSLCSVLNMLHEVTAGAGNARPELLGPVEVAKWRRAMTRTMAFRKTCPERFYDVDYREFRAEPMRIVRGVYDHFALTLTPIVEANMQKWLRDQDSAHKPLHAYEPEKFGLTRAGVREEFADYISAYDL